MVIRDLELAPRPPLGAKSSPRVKTNFSIDPELWKLLQEAHAEGFNVSHLIDSGLWLLFGKPPLSHQMVDTELELEQPPKRGKKKKS